MSKMSFHIPDKQVTGRIAQEIDWSKHPLGPSSGWPISLKVTLNTLFNSKQPVCLFWGPESYYFYNDAYIPILGEEKHKWAMGRPGLEVWKEAWSVLIPQIDEVMNNGTATWHEDQLISINRNGKLEDAYFTYGYSPVIDEDGDIKGVIVLCTETTERVISQRELAESVKRIKLMSESLPQLVWTCLPSGECNYLSKQWVEFTGRPEKEQLGFHWLDMVLHPEDRDRTYNHWIGAVQGIHPYDIEYRLRRHDGVYHWFKVRGTPLKNENGEITYWFGTCTDIQDAKQMQINYERNVDQSPAILWITERNGYCSYLSKQWYELTGQSHEEGLGFGWLSATHPDDKERAGKAFNDANDSHGFFRVEYRLKSKDGSYRWAIDAGNPRFDSQGNYLGMAGTVFDVHDRKLAEQALEKSQQDLYRTLMQAPVAVAYLKGPKLVYTLANSHYQDLIGKGDFILNKPAREALPEMEERTHQMLENVYKTGETSRASEYMTTITKGGVTEPGYYDYTVLRVEDAKGNPDGIIIVAVDITKQVLARRGNQELTNRLQAIIDNISEGLILADNNGKILLFNPSALELHGFKNMEEVISTLSDYPDLFKLSTLNKKEIPINQWPLSRVLSGEEITEVEVIVERSDTKTTWIASYSGSPVLDSNGKLILGVLTVRDVTAKLDSEAKLIAAVNSRDDFLSIASHELKTPLTSLKLQIQSAIRKISKNKDLTKVEMDDLLDKNEAQVNRLARLIDDMLDLTRVQSGKLSYNFQENDLSLILREVAERFRTQFEDSATILQIECDNSAVGLFDKERIEQAILNLLTNSIKYGEGKPVHVRLKTKDKKALIEVEDQGMGIDPENHNKIFERYERVVAANEISGLGIGLFISREIIQAHHGKLWVDSKVGQGSTFSMELPLIK